mmetsp:Transcript_11203/g.20238  ORF Transcript_11203/g.20238 Transcript_11203/m.20238 type:complete len:486 (-) Transcript_11203:438-1895(-)
MFEVERSKGYMIVMEMISRTGYGFGYVVPFGNTVLGVKSGFCLNLNQKLCSLGRIHGQCSVSNHTQRISMVGLKEKSKERNLKYYQRLKDLYQGFIQFIAKKSQAILSKFSLKSIRNAILILSFILTLGVSSVAVVKPNASFAAKTGGSIGGRSFGNRGGGSSRSSTSRNGGNAFGNRGGFNGGYHSRDSGFQSKRLLQQMLILEQQRNLMNSSTDQNSRIHEESSIQSPFNRSRDSVHNQELESNLTSILLLIVSIAAAWSIFKPLSKFPQVVRVRIALESSQIASIQSRLRVLAEQVDSSSSESLLQFLQHITSTLIATKWAGCSIPERIPGKSHEINAFSEIEQCFNQMCLEEGSKFKYDTVRNIDGDYSVLNNDKMLIIDGSNGSMTYNEMCMVVTLIVASEKTRLGECLRIVTKWLSGLQSVKGRNKEEIASREWLREFHGLHKESYLGMEIFWSPEQEDDVMDKYEMMQKYPSLVLTQD